jgi:hypothetical protein
MQILYKREVVECQEDEKSWGEASLYTISLPAFLLPGKLQSKN